MASIATPNIIPPNTSQAAPERNPENTTCGGAIEITRAKKKKIKIVRYSGTATVANRPKTSKSTPAARIVPSLTPIGSGTKKIVRATKLNKNAKILLVRIINKSRMLMSQKFRPALRATGL